MRLESKVALISGGARGIGAAITKMFAQEGAKLVIGDILEEEGRRTAKEVTDGGGECFFVKLDVTSEADWEQAAGEVVSRFGRLDILVNNAGISARGNVEETSEAEWTRTMDINVKGPFFLTQALLPLLEASASAEDPARIINIGSIDGLNVNSLPTFSYGPSKAAMHHLTRTLASHLADRFITANAIAPGPFPSKMMAGTLEKYGDQIRAGVPLKRVGEPGDMAGAAIYLASKAASYVTGVVIPVDGGIVGCAGTL